MPSAVLASNVNNGNGDDDDDDDGSGTVVIRPNMLFISPRGNIVVQNFEERSFIAPLMLRRSPVMV